MAKKMQTFKLDPDLISDLKRLSANEGVSFNSMAELALNRFRRKWMFKVFGEKK